MAKFDDQLSRMKYLMDYKTPVNETKSDVKYSVIAADGKRYGIIKEGTKYYIKYSKPEKKNISESYDYINGILAKKEYEYKSYDEATKHMELKMMSINEAHNGNVKTTIFDNKKNEKLFANLTESARIELNRVHSIFENANTIGKNNTGNPEAPKTASFSEKIGKPFDETAKAELDKDLNVNATDPTKQGEPFENDVTVCNSDMESDKAPKCNGECACADYEDAKFVPDGAVANKKPSGGKVVKVNEATVCEDDEEILGIEDEKTFEPKEGEILTDETLENFMNDEYVPEDEYALDSDDLGFNEDEPYASNFDSENYNGDDFDSDLYNTYGVSNESKISLKRIVENVCDSILSSNKRKSVKESFEDKLSRIIKEEITKLNVWGKHPGYRKSPMTVPANKEVIKTKGDKDWNHDSVKSEKPFGSKIGSSAPYDETVEAITDIVIASLKESLKKK